MTSQRQIQTACWIFRIVGAGVWLTLAAYLATHSRPSSALAADMLWSCLISGILLMICAVVQIRFSFRKDAILNVVVGVIYILLALLTPIISN
jgi:uncharacterized membrane protein YhdT